MRRTQTNSGGTGTLYSQSITPEHATGFPSRMLRVAALLFVVAVATSIASQPRDARAASCHLTLCSAEHWGYGMTAIFHTEGFVIAANWNFTSSTTFFAYPQNPTTNVTSHTHQTWSSNWWPNGTWLNGQWTKTNSGSSGPLVSYLGIGYDYDPDFNIWTDSWFSAWSLLTAWERTSASLYPADGASGAWNNVRNECKKLTPTGAVGC